MDIIRYDEYNITNMVLKINNQEKIFSSSFCRNCGDYTDKKSNRDNLRVICICDTRTQIFEDYKNFILEIPEDFSGDELEDFMEEDNDPGEVKSCMLRDIYTMVLFGLTYKKNYYFMIDEHISNNILSYLVK